MKLNSEESLSALQIEIRKFCDERNWDQFHNPKDLAISLVLEATEVMEHFQWKSSEEVDKHINENKDDVGEELADTLYYTLRLADKLDIDLAQALQDKIAKNKLKYPIEKAKNNHKKYTEFN